MPRNRPAFDQRRLEEPEVRAMHRPRPRQRREIGGTLRIACRPHPTRDAAQHYAAHQYFQQRAHQHHGRLPALSAPGRASTVVAWARHACRLLACGMPA
jgi:hypothetical protein